jgi:two-component system phosphate regulon response regulator PhoB
LIRPREARATAARASLLQGELTQGELPMMSFAENRYRVLLVEDDAMVREQISYNLYQEGIETELSRGGREALERLQTRSPDLVVLDSALAEISGLEVCQKIRTCTRTATLPILMLSANSTEADKVLGLNMGADDYVTKPFGPLELTARVKALLRRTSGPHHFESGGRLQGIFHQGRLRVDFDAYKVFADDKECELKLREFHILAFFLRNPMRVYSREELLRLIWGRDIDIEARTVDVHIRRLRTQIEVDDSHPRIIVTIRGAGYRFDPVGLNDSGARLATGAD